MPVPPFGFSVGDFVACASLIGNIIRALKDSTGSKAEFQALSQTLLSLNQALTISYVACFQWEAADIPARHKKYYATVIEGIGKERERCIKLMQDFLGKAQPYTDAFVEERGNRITRNWKKVTWLFKKDDVQNLRDDLQLHLQALQQFTNALFQTQLGANTEIFSSGMATMLMNVTELKEHVIQLSSVVQENMRPIPAGLGYAWGTSPTLTENVLLLDATGRSLLLPMPFMASPILLHDLLSIMYRGLPGHRKIARREYSIADEDKDGALIDSAKWSTSIRPGMQISLSVIFSAEKSWKTEFCPRCNERTFEPTLPGKRKICHKCQLTFSLFEKEKFVESSRISELEDDENTNETEAVAEPSVGRMTKIPEKLAEPLRKGCWNTKEDYYFSRVHYYREVLKPRSADPPDSKEESHPTLEVEGLPPLHRAAAKGDLVAIKTLLDAGENVDSPLPFHAVRPTSSGSFFDFRGCSPLHLASWFAKSRAIRLLIDHGANMLSEDADSAEALHYAICGAAHGSIAILLELGANVNAKDKFGETPLHEACTDGTPLLVSLLLEKGADITSKCSSGGTPLTYAADTGKSDIIKVLYDYGADVNGQNEVGESPLHLAAWSGHEQAVTTLLELGADVCSEDEGGHTPIHGAAYQGHNTILEVLLTSWSTVKGPGTKDISGNTQDNNGNTPLHWAAWRGHEQAVITLLGYSADVCSKDKNGNTPVHDAASQGHDAILKTLLTSWAVTYGPGAKEISFNQQNHAGRTPLHLASLFGHPSSVQLLLEHGLDVNLKDELGTTALHHACYEGHLAVLQMLVENGAILSAQDDEGWHSLHIATWGGHHEVVTTLLALGADLSLQASEMTFGATPLHMASRKGDLTILRILLQHGAKLNAQDKQKSSALHKGILSGSEEVVRTLLDAGCDPYLQDMNGKFAIEIAYRLGFSGISKLLAEYMVRDNETISELFTRLGINDGVESALNPDAVSNYTEEDSSEWEDIESDFGPASERKAAH